MRVATVTGASQIGFVDLDDPRPAPDGVVVEVAYCGVCGTDVAAYRAGHLASPSLFGHEWVGHVVRAGGEVVDLDEGDRVVVAVAPACGRCRECRRGRPATCRAAQAMMLGRDREAPAHGGFAAMIAVGAQRVMLADPRLSDEDAAIVEPAAVAYRATRRSGLGLGDVAVVQGGGTIGLLVLQMARLAGAARTVVIEPSAHRRAVAARLGADVVVAPGPEAAAVVRSLTDDAGADVVFECAGVSDALQNAVDLSRRDGTVAMVGHSESPATIQPATWLGKDIRLVASVGYARDDFARAMDLIGSGRLRVAELHTRTVGLAGLGAVFATLATGESEEIKVLVDPRLADDTPAAVPIATVGSPS